MNQDIDYRAFVPSRMRKFLFAVMMISIGAAAGLYLSHIRRAEPPLPEEVPPPVVTEQAPDQSRIQPGFDYERAVIEATKKAIPAVVTVYTTGSFVGVYHHRNPMADLLYGPQLRRRDVTGSGSGVIVDPKGVIYTNDHVIDIANATRIRVVLADGREFDARLVRRFPEQDLAVLEIEGNDLPWIEMTSSADVVAGQTVLAVGNPFGTSLTEGLSGGEPTVTRGIISATRRNLTISQRNVTRYYRNMFQTDASINEGNSGGALIDLNGRLIGINTAIYDKGGGSIGIGFAIPADRIRLIVESAEIHGDVNRTYPGFSIRQLGAQDAERIGIGGIMVAEIDPNGSAAKAGLRKGDVIVGINGLQVTKTDEIQNLFYGFVVGETVTLSVIRGSENHNIRMRLMPAQG